MIADFNHQLMVRNPFSENMVTEIIEDPRLYRALFSEEILIGETLSLYKPLNVVMLGPQGSGKSMLLNLIRHQVLSLYVNQLGSPPSSLKYLLPFLGISINLQR